MELIVLGTSSMVPTKERNQVGVLLKLGGDGLLFDCGENIQRQLKMAGVSLNTITKIFISHWHGDHVLGLPGLIQSLSSSEHEKTLEIYGPKGTKERMKFLFKAFVFDKNIDLSIKEVEKGVVVQTSQYLVETVKLDHPVVTLGYRFVEREKRKMSMKKLRKYGLKTGPLIGTLQEGKAVRFKGEIIKPDDVSTLVKGKVFAYVTDTRLCEGCFSLAQKADVLVCESTYSSKLQKKAEEYGHMTAKEAAELAASSGVGKLVLLHFSARYKSVVELEDEAKEKFHNVLCAQDLMRLKV